MPAIEVTENLFGWVWDLFQIEYPGTGLTFAAIAIGSLVVILGLKVLGVILGFSFAPVRIAKGIKNMESSGGNNRKIKVASNRKGDTH